MESACNASGRIPVRNVCDAESVGAKDEEKTCTSAVPFFSEMEPRGSLNGKSSEVRVKTSWQPVDGVGKPITSGPGQTITKLVPVGREAYVVGVANSQVTLEQGMAGKGADFWVDDEADFLQRVEKTDCSGVEPVTGGSMGALRDLRRKENSTNSTAAAQPKPKCSAQLLGEDISAIGELPNDLGPVSYTHLTLPTIYSV